MKLKHGGIRSCGSGPAKPLSPWSEVLFIRFFISCVFRPAFPWLPYLGTLRDVWINSRKSLSAAYFHYFSPGFSAPTVLEDQSNID
jgi:hypothetical protein